MSNSTFNIKKCWGRLKSKPYKQCSYKQSVEHFCKKHYVLWKKGNLITIHDTLMNTSIRNPLQNDCDIDKLTIIIQSVYRGNNIRKNIKDRGISVYCRHLCTNKTDCIDLQLVDSIPSNLYFSFIENDIHWGFSMNTFKNIIKYNLPNPYSTLDISNKDIERFDLLTHHINPSKKKINTKKNKLFMKNKYIKLQQECIDVFQLIDNLNNYTKCSWFLSLSLLRLKSLYRFMEDMWNYRLNLTKEQKLNYTSDGMLFNIPIKDIKKQNNYYTLAYILLKDFRRLLTEGKTNADRITASQWILSGLTLVNLDARNALPWLFQSAAL